MMPRKFFGGIMASQTQLVSSRSQVIDLSSLSLSRTDIGPTINQYITYISTTDHGATQAAVDTVKAALSRLSDFVRL
jgi:hypothetical protein